MFIILQKTCKTNAAFFLSTLNPKMCMNLIAKAISDLESEMSSTISLFRPAVAYAPGH